MLSREERSIRISWRFSGGWNNEWALTRRWRVCVDGEMIIRNRVRTLYSSIPKTHMRCRSINYEVNNGDFSLVIIESFSTSMYTFLDVFWEVIGHRSSFTECHSCQNTCINRRFRREQPFNQLIKPWDDNWGPVASLLSSFWARSRKKNTSSINKNIISRWYSFLSLSHLFFFVLHSRPH